MFLGLSLLGFDVDCAVWFAIYLDALGFVEGAWACSFCGRCIGVLGVLDVLCALGFC